MLALNSFEWSKKGGRKEECPIQPNHTYPLQSPFDAPSKTGKKKKRGENVVLSHQLF